MTIHFRADFSVPIVFSKKQRLSAFRKFARALFFILPLTLIPTGVSAGIFDEFFGTWRGTGQFTLKDGRTETVVCKIKSKVEVNGTRLYQKVSCKSASQKIKVRISLVANRQTIAGSWSASGAVEGYIQGYANSRSLNLQLSGRRISAAMSLYTSVCSQKMTVAGKIGKVRQISVRLTKNC